MKFVFFKVLFLGMLLHLTGLISANAGLAAEAPEAVTLTTTNGESFQAFIAGPEDSEAGILLAHDWFGVSDFYLDAASKLAREGYRVIAIDYYHGQSATTHREAYALMQQVKGDQVADILAAGLSALKKDGRHVATFGFSLGTEHAYRAALTDNDIEAVVIWYGFTPEKAEDVEPLQGDVLVVLGSLDGPAADQAASFSKLMDQNGKSGEVYIYPGAQHAFAQPLFNEGKTYDPVAASAAWTLTLDFLKRKLRPARYNNGKFGGK